MLILSSVASICCASEAQKQMPLQMPLNYWELTRNSAVVLKGTVKSVNSYVTLTVSLVLKGENESATVKFATPKISENIKFVDCFPRIPRFAAGKQ